MYDGRQRKGLAVGIARTRLNRYGRSQTQNLEHAREAITPHTPERAAPEVIPTSPDKWKIRFIERTLLRRAQPKIPIQTFGNRLRLLRPIDTLRPKRPTRP